MIHPDKALKIIRESDVFPETETIKVIDSAGRIITSDISSNIAMPSFNKSAMDGFAYNSADNADTFKVIETIPAGRVSQKMINSGECYRIMTGAEVPAGADRVIRFEYTEEIDGKVKFIKKEKDTNISYQGENLQEGDKVFSSGTMIRIQEIATLSALGLSEISVYKKPVIGLIITGSEIVNPGENIEPGKIYNSNGPQLYNQIISVSDQCNYYGIVKDEEEIITTYLEKALAECNLLIISGGVSMGDYDFVPEILKKLSVNIKFEQVAVKPGKPIIFGEKSGAFVFGLPGNPVSTFLSFEIFVKPLIYKMMGYDYTPIDYYGELTESVTRKESQRVEYRPVYFDGKYVHPVNYKGSGHINALSETNAFIKFDQGIFEINKGETVDVRQL